MRSLGVDLVEYNIDRDSAKKEELRRKAGRTSVPMIDIEGTIIQGFNPDAITAALDRNAR